MRPRKTSPNGRDDVIGLVVIHVIIIIIINNINNNIGAAAEVKTFTKTREARRLL